jgi:epoxyqueuosine reductase
VTLQAPAGFAHRLKAEAYARGAMLAGVARLGPMETARAYDDWIANGYAGEMAYLERGAEKRRDSTLPVPGAVSALVIGVNYGGREPEGPVARYARGDDYHDVLVPMLRGVQDWASSELGVLVPGKAYTDTGPILERDLGRRAGLGWMGKNTMLISPRHGSFFFIGVLLLGLELEVDEPFGSDHCGTCTRCLQACPTEAFVAPRVMDARRCVSYLTIESKGEIPEDLRGPVSGMIYGCDICQDVCPWNRKFSVELAADSPFKPREFIAGKDAVTLATDILALEQEQFSAAFRQSPMKRAKLAGLRRNATVVLSNSLLRDTQQARGTADDARAVNCQPSQPDLL